MRDWQNCYGNGHGLKNIICHKGFGKAALKRYDWAKLLRDSVPSKLLSWEEVTTDTTDIPKIIRKYYKQLYTKGLDSLEKMGYFLETYNLQQKVFDKI